MKQLLLTLVLLGGLAANASKKEGPMLTIQPVEERAKQTIQLNANNTINMRGPIFDDLVRKTELKLVQLDLKRGSANYPLYLVIDSPGGSIEAGLEFIEFARTIKNLHTITLFAASMASGIQQALPGQRYIIEAGIEMFHRAQGGFEGYFEDGEVESRLNMAKAIVRILESTNAKRIGVSIAAYKEKVVREWWSVGAGAVIAGHADEVVSVQCDKELLEGEDVLVVQTMFFSVRLAYSKCPMIRSGVATKAEDVKLMINKAPLLDKLTRRFLRI